MEKYRGRVAVVAVALLAAGSAALAQATRGSIAGTVVDTSGAVISGATITAKNTGTGSSATATTNGAGGFTLQQLELGQYDVTVAAKGFQSETSTGVAVTISNVSALNLTLQPGSAGESVTVNASAAGVQTQSSDIGTTITDRVAETLPLALGSSEMRSPYSFIFTAPGTVGPGTAGQGNFGFNQAGSYQTKLTGGQNFGDEVLLDGISTYRQASGETFDQVSPSTEALTQFRFEASTLQAEYGRTSGGLTAFNTKGGTNEFHGSAYEIFQNVVLDANNWFNNAYLSTCAPGDALCRTKYQRPLNNENDFGVTLGGPVWIPKVIDLRNKLFFFFSWEQYRKGQGSNTTSSVPVQAWRNGDFSNLLGAPVTTGGANPQPIVNPCTGQQFLTGQIFDPSTTQSIGGVLCRTPFAGNVIPSTRFSKVATNVLGSIPLPNSGAGNTNNYTYTDSEPIVQTNETMRFDWNATDNSRYFFSYSSRYNVNPAGARSFAGPADPGLSLQIQPIHFFRGGFDHTFSPTLLNHFVAGVSRQLTNQESEAVLSGFNPLSLGVTNVQGAGFPQFSGTGLTNFGQSTTNNQKDSSGQVTDQVDLQHGRHSFVFGIDYRYDTYADVDPSQEPGQFNFSGAQTAGENGSSNGNLLTGNGFASFLLGQTSGGREDVPSFISLWVQHYGAVYAQDTYQASRSLTINAGLRWDIDPPRYSRQGRQNNFSPTAVNTGVKGTGNLGALVFAGSGPGRNGDRTETWADVEYKDFAPRVGFAYSPPSLDNKTAIRGGYGIYYAPLIAADYGNGPNVTGFSAVGQPTSINGFDPAFQVDSGFPAFAPAPNVDPSQQNFTGGGVNWIQKGDGRPGMIQNWSLQLQQEIAKDLIFTLGYVGQHSTRLNANLRNPNNIPVSAFALGTLLNTRYSALPAALQAKYPAPYPTFNTGNSLAQVFRPFPQYNEIGGTGFDTVYAALGQASYNSLQATLQRQFSQGLHLQLSYTWSKTITNADSAIPFQGASGTGGNFQNPFNLKGEKGLSIQDVPQNFVASFIYELPFGQGKRFLGNVGHLTNEAIGGWQVAGILRYHTGQPLNGVCAGGIPGWDNCIRFNYAGDQRNLVNPAAKHGHFNPFLGQDRYLVGSIPLNANGTVNTSAHVTGTPFTDPNANQGPNIAYQFGNEPKVIDARIPNYYQEDISFIKHFPIRENINAELRGELFNIFNRHVFGGPNDDSPYDSANYGYINGTQDAPRVAQFQLRVNY